MAAAAQQASLKAKWMVALKTLKGIPAAAASRSLPKEDLHYMASQAEVDCSFATYNTSREQLNMHCQMQLQPVIKLVIHKLQIPLHIGKAVAALLPIPYTFHMATELLRYLTMLAQIVQFENGPADPSTPVLLAAISTQVAASGLLQQLPDALKTAQKQLQVLKPTRWCIGRCRFCERGMTHATGLGLADTGSYALQETLLNFCNDLLAIWPGTLGALGWTAVAPVLLPIAKLALSSLQYVCRQAGELHTSSSSTPSQALVDLGRTALNTCAALTHTTDTVSQGSLGPGGLQPVSGLPSGANALLSSPEMLSVLVATFNADVYGSYDQDSVSAASTPVVPDLSNPLPLMYMQVPVTPDGNLPAASWRQLCARERRLEPGQDLLPPLQAQLLGTLGCNSKGFLWLAPLWMYRQSGGGQYSHCLYSTRLPSLLVVATSMKARMSSAGASGLAQRKASAAMDNALRQFLLLPVLMLRRELNKQQSSSGSKADAGLCNTLRASTACLPILQLWKDLHEQVASTRAGAAAGSSSTAGAGGDGVSPEGLIQLTPVLHEMLQLLAHMLLGFMQMPQPGSSNSTGRSSDASSKGGSSSGSTSQGSASARARHSLDVSPAAAATAVSCVIAVLLPLATQALMAQSDSTSTCGMTAPSSSSGGSSGSIRGGSSSSAAGSDKSCDPSLAATWVPLLVCLTAVLERAMRFEAKWGPTQPELQATELFDGFGNVAGDGPNGSAAWLAIFMLLSPAAHAQYGWMYDERKGYETPPEDQRALLQWMLDNTPPQQLPAVHQRLLSVLCTASKLSLSAKGSKQLTHANQAYKGVLHTTLQVLDQLLPAAPAPSSGPDSAGSSSIDPSGPTTGNESTGTVKVDSDAVMSWLSLLGRCFLQASQQLQSRLKQHAAGTEIGSAPCLQGHSHRTHQEKARDRTWTAKELRSMYDLNAHDIPRCVVRVAVLLGAAAGHPQQQLPRQTHIERPATGKKAFWYESIDKAQRP